MRTGREAEFFTNCLVSIFDERDTNKKVKLCNTSFVLFLLEKGEEIFSPHSFKT